MRDVEEEWKYPHVIWPLNVSEDTDGYYGMWK